MCSAVVLLGVDTLDIHSRFDRRADQIETSVQSRVAKGVGADFGGRLTFWRPFRGLVNGIWLRIGATAGDKAGRGGHQKTEAESWRNRHEQPSVMGSTKNSRQGAKVISMESSFQLARTPACWAAISISWRMVTSLPSIEIIVLTCLDRFGLDDTSFACHLSQLFECIFSGRRHLL